MRSELVTTHFSCNQNCTHCTVRRPSDDPRWIATAAVWARIDEALARGAREIVLAGGEPAMRTDLVALVEHARRRGAASVVLETNGTLVGARAPSLRAAGLSLARVKLSGWGEALDGATRDPGGFARALDGLRSLLAAGLPVEVLATLARSTAPLLAGLPSHLAELAGAVANAELRGIRLKVPVESPEPDELLRYEDAVETIAGLEAEARAAGVALHVAPDSGPPPCAFPQPSRIAHLYSMTPGAAKRADHVQVAACASCQLADRCSGLPLAYLARFPEPPLRPIDEDRVRRRLSTIASVKEQVEREFVQKCWYTSRELRRDVVEHLIRVNFHCNQACRFCFVSTHLPPAGDAAVRRAIVEACAAGALVTLTGGEPTLNPALLDYVKLAKEHGTPFVGLQTNAVRLADRALTDSLVDAGLEWVVVSLHATDPALSDAITEAPGTFEKTIVGIDHLHRHERVHLTINFVVTQRNAHELPAMVRLVSTRWPRAYLNVSWVGAFSDVVPKERALVPRYTDVLPHLLAAVEEAGARGVDVGGFESMCGLPQCLVPVEKRRAELAEIPEGTDGGEFVRGAACSSCTLNKKCYGLRRSYFELWGEAELRAVT